MGIDRFFVLIVSPIMTLVMRICLYHKKDMCALHTVQVSARIVSVLGDLAHIEWPHLANCSNKAEWKIIQDDIKKNKSESETRVYLNIEMKVVLIIFNDESHIFIFVDFRSK